MNVNNTLRFDGGFIRGYVKTFPRLETANIDIL